MEQKLPLPPFTKETAIQKIQIAEDAWNGKDPVSYTHLTLPTTSRV